MLGCDHGKRREREKMVPMTDISTTTEVDETAVPTWPTYEDSGEPVELGDRVKATTFGCSGEDYQCEGELCGVMTKVSKVGCWQWVLVETDNGDGWECDADCVYLVSKGGE